jgi:hypothetical protein
MAIRAVKQSDADCPPTVEEAMAETGFDRFAAELYLAGQRGEGLANDRVFVPREQREAALRALEGAAAEALAAADKTGEAHEEGDPSHGPKHGTSADG